MAIEATQNSNNRGKTSYIGAIAVGSLCGYSFKWACPIIKDEREDLRYKTEFEKVQNKALAARNEEIECIRSEIKKTSGADEFIKLHDKNAISEIEKAKEPLKSNMESLLKRVEDVAEATKKLGHNKIDSYTKAIRPTAPFIIIGAATAFIFALGSNIARNARKFD